MTGHYATVVATNDPLKAGRVQIKVPYLHENVSNDLLPWAKQMSSFTGGSSTSGKSCIPEVGTLVWVVFNDDEDLLHPFYFADVHLNAYNPHLLFANNVASKVPTVTSVYPDVKFDYYVNGICVGVSSNASTPEMFLYHPKGTQFTVDKGGNVVVTDANKNNVTLNASGMTLTDVNKNTVQMTSAGITIEGLGVAGTLDSMVLGSKLVTVLTNLCAAIESITTINCVPGAPVTLNPASIAAIQAISLTLSTILSAQNKTN